MNDEQRLKAELGRILGRLQRLHDGDTSGPVISAEGDEIDAVQVGLDREATFTTRSFLRDRARSLAAALVRVSEGTYGTCEECGRSIPAVRLRALPESSTCIRCQARRERYASVANG